ncbi:MAG: outer membrane protein assembly factor BamA [Bacteroidetes bacterium CG02_land_8_20_14_3_00_31_25]|nr:MAG: outer membrane protein assembly factor BamA [Bacteroidetes bacterium CG02_land_8_20_14_3_00_31_25]
MQVGDTINVPGEEVTNAVKKLWDQGLFSEIKIDIAKIVNKTVFLEIYLQEKPRLSKFSFTGISKSDADDLREKIKLVKGNQVNDNILLNAKNIIRNFYIEKGFYNTIVNIKQKDDTTIANHVILYIDITKNTRVKISNIQIIGSDIVKEKKLANNENTSLKKNKFLFFKTSGNVKLRSAMKDTKIKHWYRLFKNSRYIEAKYHDDKKKVIDKLNEHGYRDAVITKDSVYTTGRKTLGVKIWLEHGTKYYFRNITWVGNTKYNSDTLTQFLGIKSGDIYDQSILEQRLFVDQNSLSSLYLDNGYLFFSITPVETQIINDSIDLELRVYEGKQATINRITITGNTKTNEHVIRREIFTKPGELFSRADIIRTQRELATLGYFDPEKMDVKPSPNPSDGTVDIEYVVEEKPSDQIELSGGWGARMVVGTLGVTFNNFSAKNFFKKEAWQPLPSGDGQRLSVRAQTNGIYYQAYSASFVEPWLGGKKPHSLSLSTYYTVQSNGLKKSDDKRQAMDIFGVSVGFGRRLKWPDDYFSLYNELSYQNYILKNYSYGYLFSFSDGNSRNISFRTTFNRSSIDQPIYPRKGSLVSLSLQLTPPYSLLSGRDYINMTDKEKYKWIEYHKWTFNSNYITKLAGDLVLSTKVEFGFLGIYNQDYGPSPFEGYNMGGDGLVSYNLYGKETISLRGYGNGSISPLNGGNIYNKFSFEVRYPLSLNPNATLYLLTFAEGGNSWNKFEEFKPFNVKRSAGVGIRIFLPMFGKLGVDWGYGFDEAVRPGENHSQFHFIIGQNF